MDREQINSNAGDLHSLSREILGIDWYDTESAARRVIEWVAAKRATAKGTPSHHWTEDPHAGQYDGERAELALGDFTDDELANAVFLHGNEMPDIGAVFAGKAKMPIVYLTAAKERIRWLSRKLDATLQALAVWERPEPWGENDIIPLGEGSITGEAYRRGVEAGRRQAARAWKEDARNWGDALNSAGWKFTEVCPEQSALLFNNCKSALREALFVYADKVAEQSEQQPLRVVADISGGALYGVYAEVPVGVLFISDDADDVSAQEEDLGEDGLHRDPNGNLIASWYLSSNGGADAEMVQHYFEQE